MSARLKSLGKSIYSIILVIQCHLQGLKVNSSVKNCDFKET